ncbi:MAG: carbohydrate kinase family protein [candidate division Zixibacteria bacterium]|nr:carbohydrate kinase family protein [candidate division Zixibacteria bacterium]
MRKITVIGSITQDIINLPNGKQTKSFGGIFYNLLTLSYLNPQNAKTCPICNLGENIYEKVIPLLRKRKNIITRGVRKSRGENNEVHLFCRKSGKRKEFLLSLVPPLNFSQIKPYLNSDLILVNFISGFDLSLKILEKIRASTTKPVYIDIHSLSLGIKKNGERFPKKPKLWKRYIKCADMLQMNGEEFSILSGRKVKNINQIRVWAEKILKLGPKVFIITLGKKGAFMMYRKEDKAEYYFSQNGTDEVVDTVGCGDVFTSAFITSYLQTRNLKSSLDFANKVASFKSTFSGTGNLRELSRFAR